MWAAILRSFRICTITCQETAKKGLEFETTERKKRLARKGNCLCE